jgi:hypothetical protein
MFLNLILISVEGKIFTFKTVDELKQKLRCNLSTEDAKTLIDNSLTRRIAYGNIVDGILTITGSCDVIEGME